MRIRPWLPLCLFLFTAEFIVAEETEKGTYDEVARIVEKEILDEKKVEIENLKVLHNKGTIYLEGVAKLYGSRYTAEKEALEVKGVKSVENEIAVTPGNVSDVDIEAQAASKIRSHLRGSPFDLVSLKVSNGFVVLTGNVRDQTLIRDSMNSVIWIRGVRGVDNKIEYASIAAGDERLRQIIFRRLRNEFPQYFLGKDPSILILVNSGRVRLVGYVDSNASREKIGSIIRSFNGVLSVDNGLQTN
ncbi:BON domain-containing protein [bacterium]|nr:BON domain-containing protein [bacterium]MCI0604462.1 BON domain-containing protein [bacterium]